MTETVADRYAAVRARIARAAERAGRHPDDVTLVVVTKTFGVDDVREAIAAGARDLGENRAQELVEKAPALAGAPTEPRWHFIGRLQRNKVKAVAPYVALWQSVDRLDVAAEIARRAPEATVLVQVNIGAEPQKGGCPPAETASLVERCRALGLRVSGLMTVPPVDADPRGSFRALRGLADELGLSVCSMGMSGDLEEAIEEGSTMVRVGSAIFGPRRPDPAARR